MIENILDRRNTACWVCFHNNWLGVCDSCDSCGLCNGDGSYQDVTRHVCALPLLLKTTGVIVCFALVDQLKFIFRNVVVPVRYIYAKQCCCLHRVLCGI